MFLRAMDRFNKLGLEPENILYISSHVRGDLAIAKSIGIRTALYAAEKIALRADPEDLRDPAMKPDRLITDLAQVRDLIGV